MKIQLLAALAAVISTAVVLGACTAAPPEFPAQVPPAVVSSEPEASSDAEASSVPEVSSAPEVSSVPEAPSKPEAPPSAGSTILPSTAPTFEGAVPESARAEDSYFDDAVFVGDSVSLKLTRYVTAQRKNTPSFFGGARFLTNGSTGSGNLLLPVSADSVHPTYNGEKLLVEDSIAKMGAKKVYIMFGMNDIALYGNEGAVANMEKLIGNILAKSPDAKIYVQSATPIFSARQRKTLNNENMVIYDNLLLAKCLEKGWYFVDVASVMRDTDGGLIPEYCSDPEGTNALGVHFTDAGCKVWLDYLYTHTA